MSYKQGKFPIVEKRAIAKGMFDITICCPEIAKITQAGQFAQVAAKGFFLRRPISICQSDPERGTIRLVFEVRGNGTEKISGLNKGDCIDIIAPLGKGFTLKRGKRVVCVGGGIGNPPLLEVARFYGCKATMISGFRSADAVILQDDFKNVAGEVVLCTDDGSAGFHGFVTQPLEKLLQEKKTDVIYACGPMGMLKNIAMLAEKYNVKCEVSLEQRMACGIGACLVCACRTVKDSKEFMSHVCTDGPVFDSKEVVFDD